LAIAPAYREAPNNARISLPDLEISETIDIVNGSDDSSSTLESRGDKIVMVRKARIRLISACSAVIAFRLTTTVDAQPVQWRLEDGGNGHFYEHVVVDGGSLWVEAEADSASREYLNAQGHLVTITSAEEETFLRSRFSLAGVWIGLTDRESEGSFQWSTGEPRDYENWRDNEPNNAGDEDYVLYVQHESGWNDSGDRRGNFVGTLHYSYIVEYPVLVGRFLRGDTNIDESVDIGDAIAILTYLFGGSEMSCLEAGDVNNDASLDISDAVGLLGFLFLGTLAPPPPFEECGGDEDGDELGCDSFPYCNAV